MKVLTGQLLAGILVLILLAGCAGPWERSEVREYLEEATGSSVTYVKTPAAFVSEQPGLASSGRDYVYIAPLFVNRSGEHSSWLWLGVWSTVDRQARNEDANPLRLGPLQIVADDEPMDLDPQPADTRPAGIRRIPYATPVPPTHELLVPVTRSQLRRLSRAQVVTLIDRPAGGATRLWRADDRVIAVLRQFSGETGR